MSDVTTVVAVVLAGGRAVRMGGGDKGLVMLGGRPMLSHIIARVRPQVHAAALNANGDPARFASFGLPVLADTLPGDGPLAGVLAGMRWATSMHPQATLLLSVPTDTPFLPPDLVARLLAVRTAAAPIACAASGGRRHPVVALWPVTLADSLAAALAAGEHAVGRFAMAQGMAVADFCDTPIDPFLNVNDPASLAAAEAATSQREADQR